MRNILQISYRHTVAATVLSLSVLTPQFATNTLAEDVTIRYGSKSDVVKMKRYLKRAEKRGLQVELKDGLGKTDCFALFNEAGEEVLRVGAKDARDIVSFAKFLEEGETIDPITIASAERGCPTKK